MTAFSWNALLREQVTWHWDHQLRARLEGLTDDEYVAELTPDAWNVHPRGASTAPVQGGSGATVIDFAFPEPDPPPVTTIAWRLGHVNCGVLAMRNASHFGREATDYMSYDYAASADEALAQLDREYATWLAGVEALGDEGLLRPCGEYGFEDRPMGELVVHIHRELIHHLAEVCLLRDLYRAGVRGAA